MIFCAAISKSIEDDAPSFAQTIYPLNVTAQLQNRLAGIEAGGDVAEHVAAIRRFLVAAPDDARFYSLLGAGEARLGDRQSAKELFEAALRLSQTEQNAAINVIAAELKAQDFTQALHHADILLRRWPQRIVGLAPVLRSLALASDNARRDLVDVLAKNPAWRGAFIADLAASRTALPVLPQIYADLQNTKTPPTDPEIAWAVQSLIAAGQPRSAYQLYSLTFDETQKAIAGLVYDAKFRPAPNGAAFDWRVSNTSGAEIVMPSSAEGGAKFEFLDQPAVGAGMSQSLLLFPGDYVLTVRLDANGLVTPEPLTASLECSNGQKFGTLKVPQGSYQERTLTLPVSVPSEKCDLQVLRLESSQIAPRWSKAYSGDLTVREISLAYATGG